MITASERLQSITASAVRRCVLLFASFALPIILIGLLRGTSGDLVWSFRGQLVVLFAILVLTVLHRRIPWVISGSIIIGICAVAGWTGLAVLGVMASAGHWIIAIAIFMSGLLYNLRGMILATSIVLFGMVVIAGLHIYGYLVPVFSPLEFGSASTNWLVEVMCALLFIALVLPTLGSLNSALRTLASDIEQRRERILFLADHDELTGLARLRVAKDRLAMACHRHSSSGIRPVVMFIDLDGFKQVNDRYGHEAGDTCLRIVSKRLTSRLRSEDTVARIGGDEFVLVLESLRVRDSAGSLAAELISLIAQPIDFQDKKLEVGASIGVAFFPENGDSVDSLLRSADQAMYRSKRLGSNGFAFDEAHALIAKQDENCDVAVDKAAATVPRSLAYQWLDAIVSRSILVIASVVTLTIMANFWRILHNQSAPNLVATLFGQLFVLLLYLFQRHIPMVYKLALTSSVGLVMGLPGLYFAGLAGPAIGWCLAGSLFLVGIFFGRRVGLGVAILILLAIALAGFGFVSEALSYRVNLEKDALHPARWLVFLVAAIGFNAIVISAWHLHKKTSMRLMAETELQIAELERLAAFDDLTGLPSLRLALDRVGMSCHRARRAKGRAVVMLVDLDGFKQVNDNFGHDAGDHCLREVASRLREQLHPTDTVARIGGDEFLIVLDTVTCVDNVSETADRLLACITPMMDYQDSQLIVSASIGIAIYPDHGNVVDTLRQKADAAMYAAKQSGKNRFKYSDAIG